MTKKEIIKTLIKVNSEVAFRMGRSRDVDAEETKYLGHICDELTTVIYALCDEIDEIPTSVEDK